MQINSMTVNGGTQTFIDKKIIVLQFTGKGTNSRADAVCVHLFPTEQLANEFVNAHTEEDKYWSYCEIVAEGQSIETYPEF